MSYGGYGYGGGYGSGGGYGCGCNSGGGYGRCCGGSGNGYSIVLVLFILLVIIGASTNC